MIEDVTYLRQEQLINDLNDSEVVIVGKYFPLFHKIYIDQPFPDLSLGRKYSVEEIIKAIPINKRGYFWHEFVHHMQFVTTIQGIHSLLAICDKFMNIELVFNTIMHENLDFQIPLAKTISKISSKSKVLLHIEKAIIHRTKLLSYLLGQKERFRQVLRPEENNWDKDRVFDAIILNEADNELYIYGNLEDGSLGKIILDSLSLREGMAMFAEHALTLNGVLYEDPEGQKRHRKYMAEAMHNDRLLTYYALYLWWARSVPKQHQSFSTFLALCEIASMYDSVVDNWPFEQKKERNIALSLPPCGYFIHLSQKLNEFGEQIAPVNELKSSIFVEELLRKMGWPDLYTQSSHCRLYIEDFWKRNKGLGFKAEKIIPFEKIMNLLEYRSSTLGNNLLLFELMLPSPEGENRRQIAFDKLGLPPLQFSNAFFHNISEEKYAQMYAYADIAMKLYSTPSFHCHYWDENQQKTCKIYREKKCEGNPFPGNDETQYQICSSGNALLHFVGKPMLQRKWLTPVSQEWKTSLNG